MVPNPRGTWYDGTVLSSIGRRRSYKYQESVGTQAMPFLVIPGNYLHARMIPYAPALETMLRNPKLGIG